MSNMHPAVVEALARQRRAELLRSVELGASRRAVARPERRAVRDGVRRLAGLIDLVGLRRPAPVAAAPCC